MKHVTFTYHMIGMREIAENCATVYIKDSLFEEGQERRLEAKLTTLSKVLAKLAGFVDGSFCCIDKIED